MAKAKSEDLNISSSKTDNIEAGKIEAETHDNNMGIRTNDLSSLSVPGESNEDFINRINNAPTESLIPWEECWLPSLGIYYGWTDGMVKVRAMGQTAEKILATQRFSDSGQSIDHLFRECCQFDNGFDPSDLLLGDRIFLLYYLRGITHGNIYEFSITCPSENCKKVSTHSYDLNELAQTITFAKRELGREPFKVMLPYLSKATKRDVWVSVRFLRAVDASDILAKRKARKQLTARPGSGVRTRSKVPDNNSQRANLNNDLDDAISQNMEKIIVDIMGVSDLFTIRQFIEKMHAQDTAAVREWLRENTPGIDNTVTVSCQKCMNEFTVELPITESFFRPAKSG